MTLKLTVLLGTVLTLAQPGATIALRTAPVEKLTVNPGFRDWAPTAIAGTTILGGNSSNRGGLFAVDTVTGKVKWASRPTGLAHGSPFVATRPAVSGNVVVVPMGNTLVGVSLAAGKELWRGPVTMQSAAVAVGAGIAYVLGDDANFYALDAATGGEKWKVAFARSGSCVSAPIVHDGSVYLTGTVRTKAADAIQPASYYSFLMALDAQTGQERWRYPSVPPPGGMAGGTCYSQFIASNGTLFSVGAQSLYAIDMASGRERWKLEVRRPVEGRLRPVEVRGLVDAGSVLVGVTPHELIAFDKASGRTAWEIAGQYRATNPSTAVAGRVLYFQGHPGAPQASEVQGGIVYQGGKPLPQVAALPNGRLNALDLDTRAILWSFSRPTAEANWSFGFVTPVDGGLWVDSYQALVKLQ